MKPLVYFVCFASACAFALAQQNKNANASAPPITPADEAAIRSLNDTYRQTALENNWAQWANLFTADAMMLSPNAAAVTGRAAIEAWGKSLPPITQFQNPIVEIDGAGSTALMRGNYTLTNAGPGQPEQSDAGKWICTLRKQDGAWKIHRCIFNSDLPPVMAAGEAPDAIKRTITTALNAGFDAAAARDPKSFAMFSASPDVRFATEGATPTVAEFRKEWEEGMKRVSQQHLPDREHIIQVLSSDIAVSTTRAKYSNTDANGAASDSVPFAFTAVWQRQSEGWRIVNAHQSVTGGWPTSSANVTTAVKAAVEKHWNAINGNDGATVDRQHTAGISMFLADIEPRMRLNSPAWLALLRRWQGAKTNWTPRDIEVQPLNATTAAASFYMDGSVRWTDGSVDSRPRRVTEIWVNENGTWKEAHHHDSVFNALPVPAAGR